MKWYSIAWFGGIKVECEECHHYSVADNEDNARAYMCARLYDCHLPFCMTCQHERQFVRKNFFPFSLKEKIDKLEKENIELKSSLNKWKDAWFELRTIIGKMWWRHEAITNDKWREYYQKQLK